MLLTSLCGPKESSNPIEIVLRFVLNLYFSPEIMYEKLFWKISMFHFYFAKKLYYCLKL